jgi:hypothetical protein
LTGNEKLRNIRATPIHYSRSPGVIVAQINSDLQDPAAIGLQRFGQTNLWLC